MIIIRLLSIIITRIIIIVIIIIITIINVIITIIYAESCPNGPYGNSRGTLAGRQFYRCL